MKILLDESLPRKLRNDFGDKHEVSTVHDEGWLSQKNGVLIRLMIDAGFEIFVTVDQNLQYQQNLEELPIFLFVLRAADNRLETLRALIPKVLARIEEGDLFKVNTVS